MSDRMTREEQNRKLKAFITCLKCEVSGKSCDDNCPTQYEAGNMGEIIENLETISKALEQEPILDKIRAEVENINVWGMRYNPDTDKDRKPQIVQKVKEHVIEILDKYKAERSKEDENDKNED